ncbi:MAG: Dam family site-specific DNA-(adenine-N6)-methyltransferase [Gammaproteobacteria bacterium]|nr:Dam family site-specific DNA-(adenine-N6)-methyltransferase [Gammaproteobacteria bacterium]
MSKHHIRPFLKWPGRKFNLLNRLDEHFMKFKNYESFAEPFLGSAAVFLNTDYKNYYLNDRNEDLINLYLYLVHDQKKFIKTCSKYFQTSNNKADPYYELRNEFNNLASSIKKSAIFLYLNRHGYNGLCRYNSNGKYNVPFGDYKSVELPVLSMDFFSNKVKNTNVKITCQNFTECFEDLPANTLVYCDPPYVPLSDTASFTKYFKADFNFSEQEKLVELVILAANNKISSIISNHDLLLTRKLYTNAQIFSFPVQRNISCKVNQRKPVKELLAIYDYMII